MSFIEEYLTTSTNYYYLLTTFISFVNLVNPVKKNESKKQIKRS